jgi:hypothetical protein
MTSDELQPGMVLHHTVKTGDSVVVHLINKKTAGNIYYTHINVYRHRRPEMFHEIVNKKTWDDPGHRKNDFKPIEHVEMKQAIARIFGDWR